MADQTMTAGRQIRLAALAALDCDALAGVTIESPGNWSTPSEALPAILLRAASDRKESVTRGAPEFTTTVTIEIDARVGAADPGDAQDAIEALCYAIEQALLTNQGLIRLCNQVVSYDTKIEISADGRVHFGGATIQVGFELPEMYDPFERRAPPALTRFGLHFDAASPFDATGNYPSPAFPVAAAPRAAGPDGRDEGFFEIQLPK